MFMQDRGRDVNAPTSVLEALLILTKKLLPGVLNDYTQQNLAILLAYSQQGAAEQKITEASTPEAIAEFLYQRVKSAPPTTFVWDSVPTFVGAAFAKIAAEQAAAAQAAADAAAVENARAQKQRDKERQEAEDQKWRKPKVPSVKEDVALNTSRIEKEKAQADQKACAELKAKIKAEISGYVKGHHSGTVNYSATEAGQRKLSEAAGNSFENITVPSELTKVLEAVRERKAQLS
jgi:hypothetical protein